LEVLSRQSLQLKKLIEDLMELSKASSGNLQANIITLDAAESVNQALGEFTDKMQKVNLTPVFYPPEEPIKIAADGRLTWRVLSNLLSNAVKYATPGTRVYLELSREDDKVLLSIKNVSKEELRLSPDELLERFVRGDASRNREGSGLGLNIAKSLMEVQGGSLQLTLDGDLFKVTLVFPKA
jgi:signal transduction histidine kinase